MKKLLVVLAAAAMLFGMASCGTTCTCKGYVNDEFLEGSEVTLDKDDLKTIDVKKCSELKDWYGIAYYDDETKTGVKCE